MFGLRGLDTFLTCTDLDGFELFVQFKLFRKGRAKGLIVVDQKNAFPPIMAVSPLSNHKIRFSQDLIERWAIQPTFSLLSVMSPTRDRQVTGRVA